MVARITLGSNKFTAAHADAVLLVGDADALRARFTGARLADEEAYAEVPRAQALPRGNEAEKRERTASLQAALAGAAAAPLQAAELAAELIALCVRAAELGNVHLMSDVECALSFGRAALDASAANVRVNHRFMRDATLVAAHERRLGACVDGARLAEAATLERIAHFMRKGE